MTSKWIQDLYEATYGMSGVMWKECLPILERIDKLLKEAMHSVDDEELYDRIRKEINGE